MKPKKGFPSLLVAFLTVIPLFSIGLYLGLMYSVIVLLATGVALTFCFWGIYQVVTEYGQEMYRAGKSDAERELTLF